MAEGGAGGEPGRGPARILRLITAAESVADPVLALNFLRAASLRCWWTDSGWDLRQRVITLAERLATGPHDPELLQILATVSPVESGGVVMERLASLRGLRFDAPVARILGVAGSAVGAYDLALPFLDAAIADLRTQGRLGLLAQALVSQMWSLLFGGDVPGALLAGEEAERLARETGQARWHRSRHRQERRIAGREWRARRSGLRHRQAQQGDGLLHVRPRLHVDGVDAQRGDLHRRRRRRADVPRLPDRAAHGLMSRLPRSGLPPHQRRAAG